jgi:hypothetical protein
MQLYILKCNNNKYYIGTTELGTKKRLAQHTSGRGAAWTKKYKPLRIEKEIKNCDKYDEDKWTKIYMDKYGIQNVRGGSYSQIELDDETITLLEREVNHANKKCLFCGEAGHFINQCPSKGKPVNKKNKYRSKNLHYLNLSHGYESADEVEFVSDDDEEESEEWSCSYCNKSFSTEKGTRFHENVHCKVKKQEEEEEEEISVVTLTAVFDNRKDGIYELYGKKYLWCDAEIYEESSRKSPKQLLRYIRMNSLYDYEDYNWKPMDDKYSNKKTKGQCKKCGRNGHFASKCYAKKHIKGYFIKKY